VRTDSERFAGVDGEAQIEGEADIAALRSTLTLSGLIAY
jgi:hypothetical protein